MKPGILTVAALALPLIALTGRASAIINIAEGSNNISVATIARNAVDEPMLQISIGNPAIDPDAEITALTVTSSGNGNDAADLTVGGLKLYWDKDGDGRLTPGGATPDALLGSGNYAADNGTFVFTGFTVPVAHGGSVNLLVLYSLGPSATAGKNFRARIASNTHVSVRNAATLAPLSVTGAVVQGFTRTVGAGKLTFVRLAQSPDGAVALPNRARLPLINLQVSADDVEAIDLTSIDFLDTGSANSVTGVLPGTVRLFNQTAQPTVASTPIATGSFISDDARVTLTPASALRIPRNSNVKLWVSVDVVDALSENIGSKYKIQLPATTPIVAAGVTSTDAPAVVGAGVSGPEWQFNYNPIVFSSPNDLGAIFMPSSSQKFPMLAFQVRNDPDARSETASITEFKFHAAGTLNDASSVDAVQLYQDNSPRGKFDPSDVLIASGAFSADDGTVLLNFSGAPIPLAINGTANFLVTFDLNGTATDGQTANISLQSRADMQIVGSVSLVNGSLIPTPFAGATRTIGQPRATMVLETNQDKIPSIVAPGATDFPLLGFRITNGGDEDMLFKGVNLDFTGPLSEASYFTGLELWLDVNGDGIQDAGTDLQLGPVALLVDAAGDATLSIVVPDLAAIPIARNQSQKFTLYGDVSPLVLGDGTETFNIVADADADLRAFGAGSDAPFSFTSPLPPFSAARTIRNPVITLTGYPAPVEVSGCINASYGFMGNAFAVPSGEDLLIQRVRFTVAGTLDDPSFIVGGLVWHDKNKNMLVDTSESSDPFGIHSQVNPVSADDGPGVIDLSADPGRVTRNKNFELSVALGFQALDPATAQAQKGKTVTVIQAGDMVIEGIGARSGRPIEVINPPTGDQGRNFTFSSGSLTVSLDTVPRTAAPPNGRDIEVFALLLKTGILEDVRIDTLHLTPSGTIDESTQIESSGVKIYIDDNKNGKVDNNDYLYAVGDPPAADNGVITFTAPNYQFSNTVYSHPPGGHPYDQFLVTVDLKPTAPEGTTLQFNLQNPTDIVATGACSLFPYAIGVDQNYLPVAPPLAGPVITVQRGAIDLRTDNTFANAADNTPEVIMAPSATAYEVMRLDIKATNSEDVQLNGITLRSTGTASELLDLAPFGVALYKNAVSPANLITSGTFTMDDGSAVLANFRQTVTLTDAAAIDLRIAFTGTGAGALGNDFHPTIAGVDLEATGLSSGLAINSILPADPYVGIPVRLGSGRLYVRALDADGYVLPVPSGQPPKIQRLRFAASRTEAIELEDLTIRASGTADETTTLNSGAILMNRRVGSNPPTLMGSAPFAPGDDGLAALRNLSINVPAGSNTGTQFSLDAVLNSASAVLGTTLRMDIESSSTLRGVGALSGQDVQIILEDFAGDDSLSSATLITGRSVTLSTGLVTVRAGNGNPGPRVILGTDQKIPLLQLRLDIDKDLEGVTISDVRICASGSADETALISALYLYRDVDGDGVATAADVLLGTATFNANDGTADFSGLALSHPAAAQLHWVVAADLNGSAQQGQTVQIRLCEVAPLSGTGQLTGSPLSVKIATPAPAGSLFTIGIPDGPPTPHPNRVRTWQFYE